MKVNIDSRDLQLYEIQLEMAAEQVLPEARKVVAKGSLNIKTDARRMAPKGPHTPHYANSITYETGVTKTTATGEIGPEHGRQQAELGGIFELGSPTSPPQPHMTPAGDLEEPRFYQAMEDLAVRLVEHGK
jgi:hypothetical protein